MPETPFNPDIDYPHLARKQAERISELEAENRRIREALEPFARAADEIERHAESISFPAERLSWRMPLADCQRARAILSQEEKP